MDMLNQLFSTFKVTAEVFHNGQYCGNWALDTSGSSYISFHIVSHGHCYLRVGQSSETITLQQGDIVLFPQDTQHCMTNDLSFQQPINQSNSQSFAFGLKDSGTGLVCGYFAHHHPLVTNITQFLPSHIVVRYQAESPNGLMLLIRALMQESKSKDKGSRLILEKIAETILAVIFRDHLPSERGILAAMAHPKLAAAVQAIHKKPENKWTVESLAECCYMSRASFSELFKQVAGQSPMEYVTQWRLSLAYRLLADERVSTLQAALQSGYDNESSFSKAFKRVIGLSPGSVRAGKKLVYPALRLPSA